MGKKLERCISKVKKQKGVRNAHAICIASLKKNKNNFTTKKQIKKISKSTPNLKHQLNKFIKV